LLVIGRVPISMATSAPSGAPPASPARARHLTIPLSPSTEGGATPRAQDIPWAPECFRCGGGGTEMVFS